MRHVPLSIQGIFFAPILICLFFVLKAFCPDSAGSSCFADQFALPIFLPLVALYKIFGSAEILGGHEFLFIAIYWAIIGFLVGLIFDLWKHKDTHPTLTPDDFRTHSIPSRPIVAPVRREVMQKAQPIAAPVVSAKPKLPINLLDRKEEDLPR